MKLTAEQICTWAGADDNGISFLGFSEETALDMLADLKKERLDFTRAAIRRELGQRQAVGLAVAQVVAKERHYFYGAASRLWGVFHDVDDLFSGAFGSYPEPKVNPYDELFESRQDGVVNLAVVQDVLDSNRYVKGFGPRLRSLAQDTIDFILAPQEQLENNRSLAIIDQGQLET